MGPDLSNVLLTSASWADREFLRSQVPEQALAECDGAIKASEPNCPAYYRAGWCNFIVIRRLQLWKRKVLP